MHFCQSWFLGEEHKVCHQWRVWCWPGVGVAEGRGVDAVDSLEDALRQVQFEPQGKS